MKRCRNYTSFQRSRRPCSFSQRLPSPPAVSLWSSVSHSFDAYPLDRAAPQISSLANWNHQKIRYFSEPPAVHPSLIPSTVVDGGERTVALGAENAGQAQIVTDPQNRSVCKAYSMMQMQGHSTLSQLLTPWTLSQQAI
ncbi:hypothetical protein WOLCODRAFT_139143 [Wolfiporia cocos MD-104 SS10]|uniref:Uncharacterized protein n=1 Tax=Wolfiporia cocos (strain MD-104) TaxID=742152 RepID=A0A2H3K3G5_WOLCO|nr:hypothetical protein WOLCODRAFT_139143 [Wolfiporia cocos MD-104 SS10]